MIGVGPKCLGQTSLPTTPLSEDRDSPGPRTYPTGLGQFVEQARMRPLTVKTSAPVVGAQIE